MKSKAKTKYFEIYSIHSSLAINFHAESVYLNLHSQNVLI